MALLGAADVVEFAQVVDAESDVRHGGNPCHGLHGWDGFLVLGFLPRIGRIGRIFFFWFVWAVCICVLFRVLARVAILGTLLCHELDELGEFSFLGLICARLCAFVSYSGSRRGGRCRE